MELTYQQSQSTVYPELVDTTSSKTTVYLRKNVKEVEQTYESTNEDGEVINESFIMYVYDEAKLTKAEYALYMASMSSEEANTAAQLAIAELAEHVENNNTMVQLALAELVEAMLADAIMPQA